MKKEKRNKIHIPEPKKAAFKESLKNIKKIQKKYRDFIPDCSEVLRSSGENWYKTDKNCNRL